MRIVINTWNPIVADRPIRYDPVYGAISRLAEKHPLDQFVYIFDGPIDNELITGPNITGISIRLPAFFRDNKLAAIVKTCNPDVLLNTGGICIKRTAIPQILFLQDLVFTAQPMLVPKNQAAYYKKYMSGFLKKAKIICSPSVFSQKKITDRYLVHSDKIRVIYPFAGKEFIPLDENSKRAIKEKYADGKEYYFFSGSIEPRNDLISLLKAFSQFKKRQKTNMLLLIAAKNGSGLEEFTGKLKAFKFRGEVKIFDYLSLKEIALITAAAYGFVYPSLYEDKALPLLEAMQCWVPLITNNAGAIPEICGDAALYSRTADIKDLAEKMMQLFKDENLQKDLVKNGQLRITGFNSNYYDELLWQSILNCAAC